MRRSIVVVGGGPVGCVLASTLATYHPSSHDVWLKVTPRWAEANAMAKYINVVEPLHPALPVIHTVLRRTPLQWASAVEPATHNTLRITSVMTPQERPEVAIFAVKNYDLQKAASDLLEAGGAPPYIAVSLCNGLGGDTALRQVFGKDTECLSGVAYFGAHFVDVGDSLAQPPPASQQRGLIVRLSRGMTVLPNDSRGVLKEIVHMAGQWFQVVDANKATSVMWTKLVANAAINPLAALHGVRNGELLTLCPDKLQIAAAEVAAVATAANIALELPTNWTAAEHVMLVARTTGNNMCSMLMDLKQGRKTEIQSIVGEVVLMGKSYGVPTPFLEKLWQDVLMKESGK